MMSSSSSEESIVDFGVPDSSTDDELLDLVMQVRRKPKNEHYWDVTVPLYNSQEFFEHFRVSREVFHNISQQYAESEIFKYQSGAYGKVSAQQQTLIFLWFAGHATASFTDVSDRFDISKGTLFNIIDRLTRFLSGIAGQIIVWPSPQEKQDIEEHFRQNGLPNVIGAIDGTHIKIDKPQTDPESYLNRKQYYSIQVRHMSDVFCFCVMNQL